MLGEREVAVVGVASSMKGFEESLWLTVGVGFGLLAFAGSESGMGEAREIDCGIEEMAHGKGGQNCKGREDGFLILKKFHWLLSAGLVAKSSKVRHFVSPL